MLVGDGPYTRESRNNIIPERKSREISLLALVCRSAVCYSCCATSARVPAQCAVVWWWYGRCVCGPDGIFMIFVCFHILS